MNEGKTLIIMGIIFMLIAIGFIVFSKTVSIWSAVLILLSIFDIGYGAYKLKK